MSLEYSLALAGASSADEVYRHLSQNGELTMQAGQLTAPDLTIATSTPSTLSRQVIEEAFQFEPTLELTFRLDKFKDRDRALQRVLTAVGDLLRATPVDLSLLFNGETVVLTRIAGRLALHDIPGFWRADRLVLMPEAHERVAPRTI